MIYYIVENMKQIGFTKLALFNGDLCQYTQFADPKSPSDLTYMQIEPTDGQSYYYRGYVKNTKPHGNGTYVDNN